MEIKGTPSNAYSFEQLSRLHQIVEGDGSIFKTRDEVKLGSTPTASDERDVIVIKPLDDLSKGVDTKVISDQVAADLKSRGAAVEDAFSVLPGASAKVNAKTAKDLESQGYVLVDNSRRSLVPGFPGSTSIFKSAEEMPKVDAPRMTQADKVNQAGFTGKGQTVAVIDSGFQRDGVKNLIAWHDVVDDSPKPIDPVGHGTHVTGDVLSTAPDASIVAIRVMNEEGQGRPSDIVRGIQWAIANKQKYNIGTINMSLGGPNTGTPAKFDPIDRAVEAAIKAGITVVDAAGNDGPNPETIGSPADDPLGITVGSALNPKQVSDFSSRGPTADNLDKPDFTAPGEYIVSWNVPGSQMDKIGTTVEKLRHMTDDQLLALFKKKPDLIEALQLPANFLELPPAERHQALMEKLPPIYKPDEDHIAAPGTSFASPITAGIVADIKQANPKAPPQAIKDDLVSTADNMGSQFDANSQGAGFINADAAVRKATGQA